MLIKAEFLPGEDIYRACEKAIRFAVSHGCGVSFKFNGIYMVAREGWTAEEMVEDYHFKVKREQPAKPAKKPIPVGVLKSARDKWKKGLDLSLVALFSGKSHKENAAICAKWFEAVGIHKCSFCERYKACDRCPLRTGTGDHHCAKAYADIAEAYRRLLSDAISDRDWVRAFQSGCSNMLKTIDEAEERGE